VLQMKYRTRTYYTDAQKALMLERWKEGWMLQRVAQLFNRPHTSAQGILSRSGGIQAPARNRCATTLTLAERGEISRARVEGDAFGCRAAWAIAFNSQPRNQAKWRATMGAFYKCAHAAMRPRSGDQGCVTGA
jgi:hypothetical protein